MMRHSWGPPTRIPHGIALPRKTERVCEKCGIVKVTWHTVNERGFERYRTELYGNYILGSQVYSSQLYRGLDRVEGVGTPGCEVVEVET